MSIDEEKLLQLYKYIRICIYFHQSIQNLNSKKMLRDIQHDIFLYLVDIKGITELNPGSKRYVFLLAKYYPDYLKRYKYSSKYEDVLIDLESGEPEELGVSYFPNGDTLYDLSIYEKTKRNVKVRLKLHFERPILVTYINGSQETFTSAGALASKIGCHISTINLWIRFGVKKRPTTNRMSKHRKDKYGHINKVEYLVP